MRPKLLVASIVVLAAISATVHGAGAVEGAGSALTVRSALTSPPSDAGRPVVAGLLGVSCVGAQSCWAVGEYQRPGELTHPMATMLVNGRGVGPRAVTLPPSADPSGYASLVSVSCRTMGECAAVGTYTSPASGARSGNELPMVAVSAGGRWQRAIAVVLPSDAARGPGALGYLDSVACARTADCVAVGSFTDRSGRARAFRVAISLRPPSGAVSRGVELPFARLSSVLGAGAEGASLLGVSCWAPSDCVAVGSASVGDGSRSVAITEETKHGRWLPEVAAAQPPTAGPAPSSSWLDAVRCPTPGTCVAVGGLQPAGSSTSAGLVTTRGPAGWSWAPLLTGIDDLQSVACVPGGSTCSATGVTTGYNDLTLTESTTAAVSNGTVWALPAPTTVRLPRPAGSAPDVESLVAIDCPAATRCTAVGSVAEVGGHVIAYEHPDVTTFSR